MAATTAQARLQEVQDALESGEFDQTGFGSPEHGAVVELLMVDFFGFEWVDGKAIDARDSDDRLVQIMVC